MEIVLLHDVDKVGASGAVVKVAPGFARNYLIPHGLAAPANPQQVKMAQETTRQRAQKTQRMKGQAETLKQALERRPLTLKLMVGEGEKSFGSITAHDILQALTQDGHAIEKHAVQLAQPIKTLGSYEIAVRLHPEVTATVTLVVVKA